jgi:hypothetical protein
MGNVVGTLSFDQAEHHRYHTLVTDLIKKYGLAETDAVEFQGENRDHYGVHVSGLYLWWIGPEKAKKMVEDFLDEAGEALSNEGAKNIITKVQHYPI